MAVKKGVLGFYPFLGYSYERSKGEPRSITQDELQKIIDLMIEGRTTALSVISLSFSASQVWLSQMSVI